MTAPSDPRLAELFGRYWDNVLTPAEAEELDRQLAADPEAREWFRLLVLQAVAVADRAPGRNSRELETTTETGSASRVLGARRWSRRRVLQYTGGALAAGVTGIALGRWVWPDRTPPIAPERYARLGSVRGDITVRSADGTSYPTDGPVPPGSTVTASGPSASAVLFYPDGTNIAVTQDSAVTLSADGTQLQLNRGVIAADVRPPLVGRVPLTLLTTETVLTGASGAIVTLSQTATVTEVGVQRGAVKVFAPTGKAFGEVRGGELLTVQGDGDQIQKQPIRDTPDKYAPDLARPLVVGLRGDWAVGHRQSMNAQTVVVPDFWHDPYYQRKMYQIRSDNQWTHGYFRLQSDSLIRVRYRAERPGPGQVCFCVRTPDVRSPTTGMLEWNGTYAPSLTTPGGWQTIEVRADAMLNNKHAPKFGPPWIGFLIIFNTYESDLRLQVSEFRVSPPETHT
ncbi:: FecR [Gemmata massiliana]|uniref:: FecR n=1 Tax=Gemmata massiliana TaxID=1210884 RepID=A0A6P2D0D9_9BACT|nr:FecR domain-containing protein [Gemmata massiliana]VTR94838.1 : FecR [Gemmata massiliana]